MWDKQKLLEWVQELPDDAWVEPLNVHDVEIEPHEKQWQPSVGDYYVSTSHFTQKVDRTFVLRIRCRTEHEGDLTRTSWGDERWSNERRTK